MAINFPDNPSNGDTHAGFTWNATTGAWQSAAYHTATGNTAPTNPQSGDQWFDTSDGTLYVYFNDGSSSQWVGVSGPQGPSGASGVDGVDGSSVTTYANTSSFPSSNNTVGDFAFATNTKALYIWDGSEWDRMYTGANETPEWTTNPNSTYELQSGTNTVITVAASDPEGFPITYSHDTNPSNQTQATITNNGGTFTVVPSANNSHAGTFTLRFKATDGLHVSSVSSSMTLSFFDFTISPAVNGISEWTFSNHGDLILPTGAEYTITPAFDFTKTVKMWGGGAAPKNGGSTSWGQGGSGGAAVGDIAFTSGTSYILRIGGKGGNVSGSAPATAWGAGNSGGVYSSGTAGSGGGYSGIFSGSVAHSNAILMAGGGGGGGSSRGDGLGGRGGFSGGGTEGQPAAGFVAGPGTQTAGGAGAGGDGETSGAALSGGNGAAGGGGGGGGYYGGGGGGAQGDGGYGGGGGSGYYDPNTVSNATLYVGTNYTPAGNGADTDRPTNAGNGGSTGSTWYDGAIVIKA